MKAIVSVNDKLTPYEVECEVTRKDNKLVIEFNPSRPDIVPHPVVSHMWKEGVTVKFVRDDKLHEPDCGDCSTCLVPIC